MNAVEIEEAVSALSAQPFDRAEFPFAFLQAFGNKETAIERLRAGSTNTSDIEGGVLQRGHIHILTAEPGGVDEAMVALKASPRNAKGKVKFFLATDGQLVEAEEIATGQVLSTPYEALADHFGFFLPLAGISTVAEIKDNPIDIRATSRLNKLYVELLQHNEDWGKDARRHDLNQFMARLIFCFFAEDTGIFNSEGLFTACIRQMTDQQSANTHEVLRELFRAMDTKPEDRPSAGLKNWAKAFPYVNGGLFKGNIDCPRFSKMARSYLIRVGELNWKQINPDIFGSMIQAVADDDERGELGMHYTSVPNILKVLDPLFLDSLREQLEEAADNARKLLNLRKRIASIRVFDPACGSGNFLVIAYIKMREIEAEIIRRRGEQHDPEAQKSWIKLTNFYGIEIKSFAAEIARLSLLIAEFQSNVRLIGQREACMDVLPLHATGQIHTNNALQLEWSSVCPPTVSQPPIEQDLAGPTGRLNLDTSTGATEIYICGNPPYKGSKWQSDTQKADLAIAWKKFPHLAKTTDYVCGWLAKAESYISLHHHTADAAFVMTNSVCQGQQAAEVWSQLFDQGLRIRFAHQSFKWHNLAADKAGVTVVIVGITARPGVAILYNDDTARTVSHIGCFLVPNQTATVRPRDTPLSDLPSMVFGNMPRDGGHLLLTHDEAVSLQPTGIVRKYIGSQELIRGQLRYCMWIEDHQLESLEHNAIVQQKLGLVRAERLGSKAASTKAYANQPHKFVQRAGTASEFTIAVPGVSSENRDFLPVDLLPADSIISNKNFGLFDAPLWNLSLIASRIHWVWIATVCVRMRTDFSYSNTLGWNTFPVPPLTENQKAQLTRCAEDILLAREAHFPATIADLYDPETMPENLRRAHERNDEVLERIYIGRRFRNDTERLEKLFEMYAKMTKDEKPKKAKTA